MEFLSPPYVTVPRPTVSGFPTHIDYKETIIINIVLSSLTTNPTVTLIDFGFVTHAVHMDQKFVELRPTLSRDSLTFRITGPGNPRLYSPGLGFIFVVADGVPSVGKRGMIGPAGSQPPVDERSPRL